LSTDFQLWHRAAPFSLQGRRVGDEGLSGWYAQISLKFTFKYLDKIVHWLYISFFQSESIVESMNKDVSRSFESHFGKLDDPRIERHKLYPLIELLFVVLCGTICGAESWRDYVLFGKEKLPFLREHYPFINGIPSKNTFARVLAALDSEAFKHCFIEWVKTLQKILNSVIAIDGKTLCNSIDKIAGSSAIHMVSAFATEARLVLAQQKVDEKSNEITAIPKLLDLLDLKGQIITIDAMGTQKAIAKQIIDKEGDYVLALKGNQGTLNEDIRLFLEMELKKKSSTVIEDSYEEADKGHGRIEMRKCIVSSQIDWLKQKEQWAGLKALRKKAGWGNETLEFILKQSF
jgi:predicted transposase YbfD/YdcC